MFTCPTCRHRHLNFHPSDVVNNGTVPLDRFGGCPGCNTCADISEDMADAHDVLEAAARA